MFFGKGGHVSLFDTRLYLGLSGIYANFTALNLLYFKDLIVNGLYSSYTRKGSKETEGVVNKEIYGAIKGTNSSVWPSVLIFRTVFAIDGYIPDYLASFKIMSLLFIMTHQSLVYSAL